VGKYSILPEMAANIQKFTKEQSNSKRAGQLTAFKLRATVFTQQLKPSSIDILLVHSILHL
jgi:hypothetical protein